MTLHRLGAGDGYRYLTDQVAVHDGAREPGQDLTSYYTQTGNPPGRWMGSGVDVLGVEGQVKTRQMHNLFGLGMHPETGVQLGRRYAIHRTVEQRVRDVVDRATEAGVPLTEAQVADVERREVAKGERQAVAGFDCVFSPVKSVSLAWALADDPAVAEQVEAAHHAAVAHTIEWLERDVVFARTGAAGVAQVDVSGVAVAAFDHRTSRAGDPDLHTHAVISNKVLARLPDGTTRWLTLDSQALHKAAVAASERYNRTLEDEVTRRLGWQFEVRADQDKGSPTAIREIAGVDLDLVRGFSARRAQIEAGYARLVADYHREHGHTPPKAVQFQLAQQATLAERPPKELVETVGAERARWAVQAERLVGPERFERLLWSLTPAQPAPLHTARDVDVDQVGELAARALADVTGRRSTWTVRHVQAAAQRATVGMTMASSDARDHLVERIVARVLAGEGDQVGVVKLDPPEVVAAPPELRRGAGESVFVAHASERYTTLAQLRAEDRLVEHAHRMDAPRVDGLAIEMAADAQETPLAADQLAAVTSLASSGRGVGLLIGPAGTGKTTTMRTLVTAWRAGTGAQVHGLAPTAVAAKVLAAETGMTEAKNLHQWAQDGGMAAGFGRGDLVVVDEAGMVGTQRLLDVVDVAARSGAKVVLVGDHRQLGAIESGGALRLLAQDAPAATAELTSVWRFADVVDGKRVVRQWEADASLQVRRGDVDGIEPYVSHRRVSAGAEAVLTDQLYSAWRAERDAGLTSVMIAARTEVVAELGKRARADLVDAGLVTADGVALSDGNLAGVGDTVVTRKNHRLLLAGSEWVKNGDLWKVLDVAEDGALAVEHVEHGGRVLLPAEYVAERVEQGYAMTVHRAQGTTVDSSHTLVDGTFSRELLYVAMTRGRGNNQLHVVTDHVIDAEAERPADPTELARQVLGNVLRHESADRSATETLREAYAAADSMATLYPRYAYGRELASQGDARDVVAASMDPVRAALVVESPAWPALADRVQLLEDRGVDVAERLRATLDERGLDGAEDPAAVLHARLDRDVEASRPQGGDWVAPAPDDEGALPEYLRQLRETMATRAESLGIAAAADSPPWVTSLPAVPADAARREQWEQLAGRVAAFREAFGVEGSDPLGPVPREPRAAEAHAQLSAAVELAVQRADAEADGGPTSDEVLARLAAGRERLATARVEYEVHAARMADGRTAGDARREQLAQAQALLSRLVQADDAWVRWEAATEDHAVTAGQLAGAQLDADVARGRAGREARADVERLTREVAAAQAAEQHAQEAWVEAGRGLPDVQAWPAARADAERTVAHAAQLLREAAAEDAAHDAGAAARRTALMIAYRQAAERVAALESRARALGIDPSGTPAPRPAEPDVDVEQVDAGARPDPEQGRDR